MKKYLSLLMTLMLISGMIIMLGACSDDDAAAEEVPVEEEAVEMEDDESVDEESEDNLSALESDLIRDGSTTNFYLLKNDESGNTEYCYSMNLRIRAPRNYKEDIGTLATDGTVATHSDDIELLDGQRGLFTFGDIPPLNIEGADEVIAFTTGDVPTIKLYALEFYGWGLPITYYPSKNTYNVYYDKNQLFIDGSEFLLKDSEGNVVDNFYDLKRNETYNISWYEGSKFNEISLVANSRTYKYVSDEAVYEIEPIYTDKDYVMYDFSGVSSGKYIIENDVDRVMEGIISRK